MSTNPITYGADLGGDYIGFTLSPEDEKRRRDTVISQMRFGGVKLPLDLATALIDARMNLTIDGASYLTVTIGDRRRKILNGPYLTSGARMAIPRSDQNGQWDRFALVKIGKTGEDLNLTFEEENVWRLRAYDSPLKVNRDRMTRAQFAYMLCREPRPRVPFFSPELLDQQPIGTTKRARTFYADQARDDTLDVEGKPYGFSKNEIIKVKKTKANDEQRNVIATVLKVGVDMKVSKSMLIALVMCITQESTAKNLSFGDRDSIGAFQQRPSSGYTSGMDLVKQTRQFLLGPRENGKGAIAIQKQHPEYTPAQIVTRHQNPQLGTDFDNTYTNTVQQWYQEARDTVDAYLGATAHRYRGDVDRVRNERYATYEFTRGDPDKPNKRENSWVCMTRLADEVDWRCFMYRGTVYFISDEELYGRKTVATIKEFDPGVHGMDFDFDAGKDAASVQLTVMAERWFAPPGSVIEIQEAGPANNRWLIQSIERSLFSQLATVNLILPSPKLPEPAPEIRSERVSLDTGRQVDFEGEYAAVVTTPLPKSTAYGYKDPEGQDGRHAALDWFAPAGSPVNAPVGGKIFRVKPDPNPGSPASGQVFGGTVYLQGSDKRAWVFRHVQNIVVKVGDSVEAGDQLAEVKQWSGGTHVHIEAYKKGAGYRYSYDIAVDPWRLFRGEDLP